MMVYILAKIIDEAMIGLAVSNSGAKLGMDEESKMI